MDKLRVSEKVEVHEGNAEPRVFEKGKTLVVGEEVSSETASRVVSAGAGEIISGDGSKATKKAATVAGGDDR